MPGATRRRPSAKTGSASERRPSSSERVNRSGSSTRGASPAATSAARARWASTNAIAASVVLLTASVAAEAPAEAATVEAAIPAVGRLGRGAHRCPSARSVPTPPGTAREPTPPVRATEPGISTWAPARPAASGPRATGATPRTIDGAPEAVPLAHLLLAVRRRGDVHAVRGRVRLVGRRVHDPGGGPEEPPLRLHDATLGTDRDTHRDRPPVLDGHPAGEPEGLARRDGPRHHLVEQRREDPAVDDPLPALEPRLDHDVAPGERPARRGAASGSPGR